MRAAKKQRVGHLWSRDTTDKALLRYINRKARSGEGTSGDLGLHTPLPYFEVLL